MNATDIAAWLGAAAWLPQVIGGLQRWLTKPQLDLIASDRVQVTFGDEGVAIGLNVSITSRNKDGLVTQITLRLKHAKGDQRALVWRGLSENQNQIMNALGERIQVQKQQNVMALKVATTELLERQILFGDKDAALVLGQHMQDLVQAYLHRKGQGDTDDAAMTSVEASREFANYSTALGQYFYLLEGDYTASVELREVQTSDPQTTRFTMALTAEAVGALRGNTGLAREYFRAAIGAGTYPALQFRWVPLTAAPE